MKLLERGLIDRPRVLELQREEAKLDGDIGEHRAEVASARQGIEESHLRLTELRAAEGLDGLELLRRGSRLSVQPVSEEHWRRVLALRPKAPARSPTSRRPAE